MVRGMAVVLDVLTLLPHTEVVESRGRIEAHRGSFLPQRKTKHQGCEHKMVARHARRKFHLSILERENARKKRGGLSKNT